MVLSSSLTYDDAKDPFKSLIVMTALFLPWLLLSVIPTKLMVLATGLVCSTFENVVCASNSFHYIRLSLGSLSTLALSSRCNTPRRKVENPKKLRRLWTSRQIMEACLSKAG
jgi:hypothetical protein